MNTKPQSEGNYREQESAEALRGRILDLVVEYAKVAHAPKPFEPGTSPVPVSGKVYGPEEVRSLVDASLDFWLTTGRFNDAFEARLAQFFCNCASRLHVIPVPPLI